MSKVCFITVRNIATITSLRKYESILGNEYDIIYWKRRKYNETCKAKTIYAFEEEFSDNATHKEKLIAYLRFRNFARDIILKNDYEKLIVLPTQTAVLLSDILLFKFKNRYVLDIRDYTAENNKLFHCLMNKLVKNAAVVSLTSPAFKVFLPKREYIISHNLTPIDANLISQYRNRIRDINKPINIMCIGGIRFITFFKKLINIFANDERFILSFIGVGAENLKDYVNQINAKNIVLSGKFQPEEAISINMKADIANNLFGHGIPLLDYALSNRLYYAIQLGMPTLACVGTYTSEIVTQFNIGFTVDETSNSFKDDLYIYYQNIDWTEFYKSCDRYMKSVLNDETNFSKKLNEFLLT